MFSKILVKLIDQAIVPAITLLTTRLASVVIIASLYDVTITVGKGGFVFGSHAEYVFVNTYSVFSMVAVLFIALFYTLLRAFIFHDTHITPGMTAKLFTMKMETLIKNSFDLYSKSAIWLAYAFLLLAVTWGMSFFHLINTWVFYVTLLFSILGTIILILDVENELESKKESEEVSFDSNNSELLEGGNL